MAGELKTNDRVRLLGTHARPLESIPADLLARSRSRDPEERDAARAEIDKLERPMYRYGVVVGFEPDPRPGYPPRVQVVTDEDRNAPPIMVPVPMPDGRVEVAAQQVSFTTFDADAVELAS